MNQKDMKNWFDTAQTMVAQIKQSSALNPLLWLIVAVAVLAVPAMICISIFIKIIWLQVVCISLLGLVILCAICCYVYLMIYKPDLLRSEEFQLKKQQLEILGDEKHRFEPTLENIEEINNPSQTIIISAEKKENE